MFRLLLFFAVAALLISGTAHAESSAISFTIPPPNAFVEAEVVAVVLKRGNQDVDEVKLEVNGRKQFIPRKPQDRHYICYDGVKLDHGNNRLKISAFKNGKLVDEATTSLFYRSVLSGKASSEPPATSPFLFHASAMEKICMPCHDLEPAKKEHNATPSDRSQCYLCHKKLLSSYQFVHGPSAVWDCAACHGNSPGKGGSAAKDAGKLCAGCHEINWSTMKFGHGPTAAGNCTACHNPHAADEQFLLKMPPSQICVACHDDVLSRPHVLSGFSNAGHPVFRGIDPTNPKGSFSCLSCHDPHAENSPQFLKGYDPSLSMQQYCRRCHRM